MVWTQNYDPFASSWLSPLAAALPVVLLLGLLATGKVGAPKAALVGLITAVLVAIFAFAPREVATQGRLAWSGVVLRATTYGACFGLLPIGWIVLNAIFLYKLTVHTGHFEIVKGSVLALSEDRRLQALLIAFCFGAFVEGAAGFGTPVAISAALLLGAGFRPLHAAGLALLANTAPVAFGGLGIPIVTLGKVTGIDPMPLSQMAGRQLPFFSLLIPAWLVWVMAGWRGVLGVWPALLVCGGSFALVQFLIANFHGPTLVDVVAGIISLGCLAGFLRIWKPRTIWRFAEEETPPPAPATTHTASTSAVLSAWVPWVLLTLCMFVWGLPVAKKQLQKASLEIEVPGLHQQVQRTQPVVKEAHTEPAVYSLDWLAATGTGILVAAVASALWLGIGPVRFLRIWKETIYQLRWPLCTIACMLAIAFTTRYSGMDATLGIAFTHTGKIYPLFAAMLGWLGVALTGSDTSSNALFGNLQTITANQLVDHGVLALSADKASILLATTNSTGGVMGKMIDAQSIVVSAAATQQEGQEGPILRFVFLHSVVLALLMGVLALIQAYWWTGAIP